ncbi:phosphatase PAP2 family protein [Erythrobacter oryzae]|uniref:phosphatase PAP2 family protein n=1 Tax=Erythrobacter oryzae TaxID=3019556 RepID=UPI00255250B0|nr:phosphatase PAP2 family protein [Erythrobacter sp. COR-2]
MNQFTPIAVEDRQSLTVSRRARLIYFVPFPELILALCFAAIGALIAAALDLPVSLPSGQSLDFTGMSYGVPLSLIALLGAGLVLAKQTMRLVYYAAAAFAYGVILVTHFNIKLWMSLVNPRLWDGLYWQTDQMVRPLVDLAFGVHHLADSVMPAGEHLYLFAFLAMFAGSIIVHSMQAFIIFRKVIFAAMLVHVLGALAYLVMPAVGPFLYEPGVNALETARQQHMHGGYLALAAGGRGWIASEGSTFLFAAVAAMPSLHVASSAVFLYFAWKHARWLGVAYLPLFVFIVFEAVATRWHYWIDVVAGLALTALAIAITSAVFRRIEAHDPARQPVI